MNVTSLLQISSMWSRVLLAIRYDTYDRAERYQRLVASRMRFDVCSPVTKRAPDVAKGEAKVTFGTLPGCPRTHSRLAKLGDERFLRAGEGTPVKSSAMKFIEVEIVESRIERARHALDSALS